MLPVKIIKQLSYISNEKLGKLKVQPFRVILIHPSGNLTHPPHDSPTDENYNMRVALTATDLPVPATSPSIIATQKIL